MLASYILGILLVCEVVMGTVPALMRLVHRDLSEVCSAPELGCISVKTGVIPRPGKGYALIKVMGSSINHDDLTIFTNTTLGLDASGVVLSVGEACGQLRIGDRVWGTFPWDFDPVLGPLREYGSGGMAEYASIACAYAALAPSSIGLADAGTFPGDAETSLGAFQTAGAPWTSKDFAVLINAGTGGTGYSAVQLAKLLGATKVVTAAGNDDGVSFVKALGADVVVDYHKHSVYEAVADRSVDVVYDNLGRPEDLEKAMTKLKSPGGFFVSIVPATWNGSSHPPPGVKQVAYNVWSAGERTTLAGKLNMLAGFIDSGKLRVHVNRTYGFDRIKDAYNQFTQGHILSKIGVSPQQKDDGIIV